MPIAYFPSLKDAEILEVALLTASGADLDLRLFVDTGFTGTSLLILSKSLNNLWMRPAPNTHAFGAIHGVQQRVVVSSRVPALSFHVNAVAILTDLAPMGLPSGVQGLAGLQFLR